MKSFLDTLHKAVRSLHRLSQQSMYIKNEKASMRLDAIINRLEMTQQRAYRIVSRSSNLDQIRPKRGLIDPIGQAAGILFGVATTKDIERISGEVGVKLSIDLMSRPH